MLRIQQSDASESPISSDNLVWYIFAGPGSRLQTACVTRLGGVSPAPYAALNLGSTVGDSPDAVRENMRRLLAAFGLAPERVVSPHQVHGR
ncbi:MAG: laccase domain-containing protein, partial [Anaerolineae bacterium]|nr:laccase domain-containing protein [Anaerolineae bacterium]